MGENNWRQVYTTSQGISESKKQEDCVRDGVSGEKNAMASTRGKERKKRGGLLYHGMHDWRLKRTRLRSACGWERSEVENDTWKKKEEGRNK